ncbi:replication initiation factor domain-containing protein [Aeromonas veronii]|uniref:replication initiation factor domain-containing protein n=1 Tax=Aeromonas veronii TaxID=654 RepID=UPI0021E7FFD5|nr:replication initiation factor domain-containing protein [Aeromonas veronii]MCV3285673.1 replication initiation factor domain-containing protein [Aeromonas veronii]
MTGKRNQLTKIDYLSFTFAPVELRRMTELAKAGAVLKAIPRMDTFELSLLSTIRPMVDKPDYFYYRQDGDDITRFSASEVDDMRGILTASHFATMEHLIRSHYKQGATARLIDESRRVFNQFFSVSEFDMFPDVAFHDSYAEMVKTYGVQWLDHLCRAELTQFMDMLNHDIGVPIPAPRFSLRERKGGLYGYSASADILLDGLMPCGVVAWGAINHGVMVSFSGAGCDCLDFVALRRVLSTVAGVRITRVDIALDDYDGRVIKYVGAVDAAESGLFNPQRGQLPSWMAIQSGSIIPSLAKELSKRFGLIADKGCSFYVGSRKNGKCGRIYEKGLQMQSEDFPHWVRAEGELHNKDREIPLDVLDYPDDYFAGMYPAFEQWLSALQTEDVIPTRVITFKNKFKTCRDNAVHNMSRMAGRLINWLYRVEDLPPDVIVKQMINHLGVADFPARLLSPPPPECDFLPAFEPQLG